MAESVYQRLREEGGVKSASDDTLWALIRNEWHKWLIQSHPMRADWRLANAFLQGYQWSVLNVNTGEVVSPPLPSGRKKVTVNLMKPWALDVESKFDIATPVWDVDPNTIAQDSKDAARSGEGLAMHYWRVLKIRRKYREQIVRYGLHAGGCFGELEWDEGLGRITERIRVGEDGKPILDGSGQPIRELETEGDLRLTIFPYKNVICDELPGELDQKSWVMMTSWMHIDKIWSEWDEGKDVEPEAKGLIIEEDNFYRSMDRTFITHDRDYEQPGAHVFKMMLRPNDKLPEGILIEASNTKILRRGEWPEQYRKLEGYPLVHFPWYVHPGNFRGTSPVMDQIPVAREINKCVSQIAENRDAVLAAKIMNPNGSGVDDIDDIAGQIVDYNLGFEPHLMQMQPLPQSVFRNLLDNVGFLEDIQMWHTASRGKNVPGGRSGAMLEVLQEADDRPMQTPESSLHEGLELLGKKILQICSEAITVDRTIKYTGPDRRRHAIAFKGADLKNNTDVHLTVQGGSSKSRAGVVARMIEFLKYGMFRKPDGQVDDRKVFDILRNAIPDVLYEEVDLHENAARDENDMLWEGQEVRPEEWDRHDIHLPVHEEEMLSTKWKTRAQDDPVWARGWLAHRQLHKELYALALQTLGGGTDNNRAESA